MAKVIAVEYATLDGVFEDPHLWPCQSATNKVSVYQQELMFTCDALLLDRKTYEAFAAAWPSMPNAGEFGERINAMPKYVATTTLPAGPLPWNRTRIEGDVAAEVAALKEQSSRDLMIYGSAALVRTLLHHDLIDDYRLIFFPLVLGKGKRLFEQVDAPKSLKPVETQAFTYRSLDTGRSGKVYAMAGNNLAARRSAQSCAGLMDGWPVQPPAGEGPCYNAALEPCTSFPDLLDRAVAHDEAATLAKHATNRWTLHLETGQGEVQPSGIADEDEE